ncbi:hypothetical protein HMPREF1146_1114 [Prevotella sp. MSX73]|nr:hypothetical protein HMPREF1146_1114 [Prevotella sp. MSX73]
MQKSHSQKLKGPQLHRNCGPFASPFGPIQACFPAQISVSKIQTVGYQLFGNAAKIARMQRVGWFVANIASREAENEQKV